MTIRRSTSFALVLAITACKDDKSDSGSGKADPETADGKAQQRGEPGASSADEGDDKARAGEALLDKAVEAAGGDEKFAAIENFHVVGKIQVEGLNIRGSAQTWWQDGDFYGEEEVPGQGTTRVGKLDDVVWSADPIHGLRRLQGVEAEQLRWASSLMLPAEWEEHFETAELIATREVEGQTVHEVSLRSKSGGELQLLFADESGLLIGQKFQQATPMGSVPIEVQYGDYREVDGIKIPFKHVIEAGMFLTAEQTVESIEINHDPIDDTRFAMPDEGVDVVDAAQKPK